MGRLDVRVCACRNLADTQWVSKPDPYCIVRIDNQKHKTTVKENNLNPEWNEVFKFVVADENSAQLQVEVWNHNVVTDELMGSYSLALNGLQQGVVRDEWFLLQRSRSNAEIRLRLLAHDFGKSGGAVAAGSSTTTNTNANHMTTNAYPAPYQATGGQPQQQPYAQQQVPQGYPQQQQQAPQGYPQQQQPQRPFNPMPQYGSPQPAYSGYPPQQVHPAYPMPPRPQGAVPYQNVYYGAPQQPSGYYPPAQQAPGYAQQPYAAPPVSGVPLGFGPQPSGTYGTPPPPAGGAQPYLGYPPPPMSYPQQQGGGGCAPSW